MNHPEFSSTYYQYDQTLPETIDKEFSKAVVSFHRKYPGTEFWDSLLYSDFYLCSARDEL
jgi:hypothetical protein